jgi:hypothetical protein
MSMTVLKQILQRRLASSPAAIFHSLRRRRERLETRLAEERIIERGGRLQRQEQLPSLFDDDKDTDLDEAGGAELEQAEQEIVDRRFISRLWRLLRFREERR